MSFNLTCDEFDPVQTPTSITFMILSFNEDRQLDGGWQGVYKRYVHWLEYCRQVGFNEAAQEPERQKQVDINWKLRIMEADLFYKAALESGGELHFDYV